MAIIAGYDSKTRERVYTDNFNEQKEFGREAFKTPTGQRFLSNFENSPENIQVALAAAATLYPGELVTVSRFIAALEATMNAGDLIRKPAPPVVAPTPSPEVPRTRSGVPMTEPQQRWSEYRTFSESHSMNECRARARTDAGYASFMHKEYERESVRQGEGTILNASRSTPTSDTPADLLAWVREYLTTPADRVRQLRRMDSNPLGYIRYNEMFELAASKNLI